MGLLFSYLPYSYVLTIEGKINYLLNEEWFRFILFCEYKNFDLKRLI